MKLSNALKLFVLVIIALFLLSAQVTLAQEPTDTPDDESGSAALGENSPVGEAVTPTDDEAVPPVEVEPVPTETPSPLHDAVANLINVFILLEFSGGGVMGAVEVWKQIISKVPYVKNDGDVRSTLIVVGALSIGVGFAVLRELNIFAGFPDYIFGNVPNEVAWILSGFAVGGASFLTRQQWKWFEAKADQAEKVVDIIEPLPSSPLG
jgi:hypothetical protein